MLETTSSLHDFALRDKTLSPTKIVLLYACIGIGWILFSDTATAWFIKDIHQFEKVAIWKGISFIILTSGMLFLLIRNYAQQLHFSQEIFHQAELEITKLAHYDKETGLPNHNLLLDRLNQVIAARNSKRFTAAPPRGLPQLPAGSM